VGVLPRLRADLGPAIRDVSLSLGRESHHHSLREDDRSRPERNQEGLEIKRGEYGYVDILTAFGVAADVATVLGVSASLGAAANRVIKKNPYIR
jgi:hypothetical protein